MKSAMLAPQWRKRAFFVRRKEIESAHETKQHQNERVSLTEIESSESFDERLVFPEIGDREPQRIHQNVFVRDMVAERKEKARRIQRPLRDGMIGG